MQMAAQMERMTRMALDPTWLAGPIFDKELRVSSRRRRNYSLRFFYVAILAFFVVTVWLSRVDVQGNATVQASRMAEAGKAIIRTVVLFQFVATQILAAIMLSNAISDEIYHRTLGLLMTTPINSFQIVMGKVLSRLLQLVQLLAITFPILAIVRVLGGVPWGYLLSSLCITLTAAVFAGSASLLISIKNRRSYAVILQTLFLLFSFYCILPMVIGSFYGRGATGVFFISYLFGGTPLAIVLLHSNPVAGIWVATTNMLSPIGAQVSYYWPVQCLVTLGLAVLLLICATAVVRKVALRQATGQLEPWSKPRRGRRKSPVAANGEAEDAPQGAVKRVIGPPVIWRELRAPFIQGVDNRNNYIGLAVTIGTLLFTYLSWARAKYLDESFVHTAYVLLFGFLGTVVNVVFATTRITSEKESQSWLLLLATPLSDADILLGKAVSAVRRCVPLWGLLAGHVILFILVGYIHPVALVHLAMVIAWVTCFVTGAGLYFGTRFKRTTSAVVAGFTLILGLWGVFPIVVGLLTVASPQSRSSGLYMWTHPAMQAHVIMEATGGRQNADLPWNKVYYDSAHFVYHPEGGSLYFGGMTRILSIVSALYILVGLLFFWRAKRRLRRNVFA
jgi:ABC-type transport system involved in multi-copper enzyme maturation permease subunit